MREKQVATFLMATNRFAIGVISSEKPCQLSSLSDVLESKTSEKYTLSPKACEGILRRAEKRGKTLPERLRVALQQAASREQTEPAQGM